MKMLGLDEIKGRLDIPSIERALRLGFIHHTQGHANIPLPGELVFDEPPGDLHIKYGTCKGSPYYVIKVAACFYVNKKSGLDNSSGCVLVGCAKTGRIIYILQDEGYLTNLRTAITGRIVAQLMGLRKKNIVGIIGTGTQAKLQLTFLPSASKKVYIYARSLESFEHFCNDMKGSSYDFVYASTVSHLMACANYIVTTTPSEEPLIYPDMLRPGQHITAIGSDTLMKQELAKDCLHVFDKIIVDCIDACKERGEVSHAFRGSQGCELALIELGQCLENPLEVERTSQAITLCDLTGLAIQDLAIASAAVD